MQQTPPDVINALQQSLGQGGTKLFDVVPTLLRTVLTDRVWAECVDRKGEPFSSFEAFTTHKLWWGLESSIADLLSYCRNTPDVQQLIKAELGTQPTHADAGAKGGRGNKAADNVRGFDDGNSPTYALRRLKRDRPDLAEQVVAGALSAHAAAVQAGFRKQTWTAPADVELLAAAISKRYPGWRLIKDAA